MLKFVGVVVCFLGQLGDRRQKQEEEVRPIFQPVHRELAASADRLDLGKQPSSYCDSNNFPLR